ncbi:MAG: hypothetical protein H7829_18020 [Magnetococcus sp. THC-1_WYH]
MRVEEELRHQRELMQQGFLLMDKRFEEIREDMNKRFEAMDKHFEQMEHRMDALTRRMDRFMIWSFEMTVAATGTVISVLKLFP